MSNLIIYPTSSAKTLPSSTKSSGANLRTVAIDVFTQILTSQPVNIASNIDQAAQSPPSPDTDISLRFADRGQSDDASSGHLVQPQLEPSVKSGAAESTIQKFGEKRSSEVNLSASNLTSSISTTIDSTSTSATSTSTTIIATTTTTTTTTSTTLTTLTTSTTTKPVSIEELRFLQNEMVNGLLINFLLLSV